jgi:hypothetical protein
MGMFPTHNHSERSKYSDFSSIMSSIFFYLQALFLGLFVIWFFSRSGKIDRFLAAMVAFWIIGVCFIYFRYGAVAQLWFYQNDQIWHWKLVDAWIQLRPEYTLDGFNFLRVPYTVPALMLHLIGFNDILSLKFVSLVSAVLNYKIVRSYLEKSSIFIRPIHIYAFSGPFILFFSLLALRETTMLLFVSIVFFRKNLPGRVIALIALGVLRPHLAVAIAFGFAWGWFMARAPRGWYLATVAITALVPIWIGTVGFSLGNLIINKLPMQLYQDFFLKSQITQVFSSFVGLQFLTVAYQTVEYTTQSILLIRLIFPEIVLVPLLFTSTLLIYKQELTQLKLTIFSAFVFFVAVSSGTEYLSVRQTLPFFPILAIVVIRTYAKEAVAKPEELAASRATN